MGITGVTIPPDPIQAQPTLDGAQSAFEALHPIRILFDNGAGGPSAGYPSPGFEQSWPSLPIPGTRSRAWYLGDDGALTDRVAPKAGADAFTWNAKAQPLTDFSGDTAAGSGGLWTATPTYNWTQSPSGSAASYLTSPLSDNTAVIGAGALHAWVRSSAPNVDLQATISEVRPDGKETFVQGGWLRADERKLDAKSTALEPVLSLRKSDVQPLPTNKYVEVTIPLYYEGHAYRAGSRIRVTIAAPNGTQPIWAFDHAEPEAGNTQVAIAYGAGTPSNLLLPVVPGVSVPTGLPPCPGLRGEPCRDYQPYTNRSATP